MQEKYTSDMKTMYKVMTKRPKNKKESSFRKLLFHPAPRRSADPASIHLNQTDAGIFI
ncbi:Uncharacterised protein [Sphingobacterium thalpophilum]|uniref:Uncharacterized protein n=1 Tax=Sphingobacterium thalpophilum TaxID=259 RepID=A0A4U9W518_9SPHI|nr:Uncharacterised protein [Sphingobacterium thalpophilum]